MVRKRIVSEIARMEDAIKWAQSGLKHSPEGRLLVETQRGALRYYWRKGIHDKRGTYLGKDDQETHRALEQKEYDMRLLKAATKEKDRLEKMLARYDKASGAADQAVAAASEDVLDAVYASLPEERQALVKSFELTDEEYARQWLAHEYEGNGHTFGGSGFYSMGGTRVRSKSEVIIADALEAQGVPYRYEQALDVGGYNPVYPDFTVLNRRTRKEYIWEHFGAMDDADYCDKALRKLNKYARAGYVLGDKLLATYESGAVPLDTRMAHAVIEHNLK